MFGDKRRPPATIAAEIDRIIGLNIRRSREDLRLGQHEVAGLLGISAHVLARYEDGQERTPASVLLEITRHLGCQLTDLFAGMPSLDVEEEFQGSRPSTPPAGESAARDAACQAAVPSESDPVQDRPQDAAVTARIIEAYAELQNPVVRERLLQLLQALQ